MTIPVQALKIAIEAVNAGSPELSYLEHVLHEAKAMGCFDGSLGCAIECVKLSGFEVR
jgi:hypothetical protein